MADHPAGAVAFCDSSKALKGHLRPVIRAVGEHRGILQYEDAAKAMSAFEEIVDGSIVCVVAERTAAIELARFLRTPSRRPWLRSIPLLVLTRDAAARAAAARVGSIVVRDVEKLTAHILSLPSKEVIQSEVSACHFKGLLCDLSFGHFEGGKSNMEWNFSENTQRIRQGLNRQRVPWYPECSNYEEHIDTLASYFSILQPVHRCSPGVFLGMLRSGGLMSRTELEAFLSTKSTTLWAKQHVNRHALLQELCRELHADRRILYQYSEQKCIEIYENEVVDGSIRKGSHVHLKGRSGIVCTSPDEHGKVKVEWNDGKKKSEVKLSDIQKDPDAVRAAEKAARESRELASKLKSTLPMEHHARIDEVVNKVAHDMITASKQNLEGVGYHKDRALGTHRHVFSTLGVNGTFGYGSIVIVLKSQILHHPDCWISPLAATGYVGPHYWVFRHRPWSSASLAEISTDPDVKYPPLPDQPDSDSKGVEACIQSSFNLAATAQWPVLMAREVDAMCHYLCYGHREPTSMDNASKGNEFHGQGKDWKKEEVRTIGRNKRLNGGQSELEAKAWEAVVDFYETRDSHTQFECHLPGIVPLGAIDKIIIRKGLYRDHTDIKDKVDSYVLPDGRRLCDLVHMTSSPSECMTWQHDLFETKRRAVQKQLDPCRRHPVSVQVSGRVDRPVFLPSDFRKWFGEPSSFRFSFCTRCSHDIRVYFSSTAEPQRDDCDLSDKRWTSTTYMFAIGFDQNRVSYISKGITQSKHSVHVEKDPLVRCTTSKEGDLSAIGIWDRYWFEVVPGGNALVRCGRGPFGENVMMSFEDTDPIRNLQYIGVGCWREPTVYCDLQVSSGDGSVFPFCPADRIIDDDQGIQGAPCPAPSVQIDEADRSLPSCKLFWWG
ncbi:unnamed protein product [Symbiodinium natans]|uniref:Farnesoic acid O-methyl transferase domain-containing protein n=1 Tax=Symbiodinium natans TaxID=878477 RepID=A0A812M6G8_9DINO|nr:unnamed protein product [Symbiodinium natans]